MNDQPTPTPVGEDYVRRLLLLSSCFRPDASSVCMSSPCACAQSLIDEIGRPLQFQIDWLSKQCAGLYQSAMNNGQDLLLKEAEVERLQGVLSEIHRRTGLLLHQNQGRWDFKQEHQRRVCDVLNVNQLLAEEALR